MLDICDCCGEVIYPEEMRIVMLAESYHIECAEQFDFSDDEEESDDE